MRNSGLNPWKLWPNSSLLFHNFLNSELQEAHFYAFYSLTLLLLRQIALNNIVSFFLFILLYYIFYIFLYFRIISEYILWETPIEGPQCQSGLRITFRNLSGSVPLHGILCHQFYSNLSRHHFLRKFVLSRVVSNCIEGIF